MTILTVLIAVAISRTLAAAGAPVTWPEALALSTLLLTGAWI